MRPRNGFLLFLAMHLVVVASLFSFTVSRGHDTGRSITCSAIWGVASVALWMLLVLRERSHALVGLAVACMIAAVGSGLLSLVQFGSAGQLDGRWSVVRNPDTLSELLARTPR